MDGEVSVVAGLCKASRNLALAVSRERALNDLFFSTLSLEPRKDRLNILTTRDRVVWSVVAVCFRVPKRVMAVSLVVREMCQMSGRAVHGKPGGFAKAHNLRAKCAGTV